MKRNLLSIFLILGVIVFTLTPSTILLADNPQQALFEAPIVIVNTSFLNIRTGPSAQFGVLTTAVGGTELPVLGTVGDGVWYQVSTSVGVGWINIEYTIARGDFTNVPLVEVTTNPIQPVVIEAPQTSAPAVVAPQVNPATSIAGTASQSSTSMTNNGIVFRVVLNQTVSAYVSPSESSDTVATLFADDRNVDYAILDYNSSNGVEMILIDIPGVGSGWVVSNKVDLRLARMKNRDVLVVVADVIALTTSPGGGNNGLPIVTNGTEGYLVDISSNVNFVKIQLGTGEEGWVPFSSVEQRRGTTTDLEPLSVVSMSSIMEAPVNTDTTLEQGGGVEGATAPVVSAPVLQSSAGVAIINTSFLNIRSGPGAQYTGIFTARGGSEFTVLGVASDGVWFLVQGAFGQGWVNNEYIIYRGNIENVPIIRNATGVLSTPIAVIGSSVQLYAAPGANLGLLGSVAGPVEAPIVARTEDFEWIQINTSAGFGWVLATQVTIRGDVNLIPIVSN